MTTKTYTGPVPSGAALAGMRAPAAWMRGTRVPVAGFDIAIARERFRSGRTVVRGTEVPALLPTLVPTTTTAVVDGIPGVRTWSPPV